jgi:hypothetical protein
MKRRLVLGAALVGLGWFSISTAAQAAGKAERKREAAALVSAALQSELAGENDQRAAQLGEALEKTPDFAPALWHAGYVRAGKKWLKVDVLARGQADDARLAAYRLARQKHADTVEGQMELARWCAGKKLVDQQRAHLSRVIELAPNHAEARRLLGQRLVGGQWRSEAELTQASERAAREAADLARWRPRLEALRDRLTHENRRLREAARDELGKIDDPSAAAAIEVGLAPASEELAKLALETLHAMSAPEASLSITRLALSSPWESVRDDAAEKLRSRDKHHYVPYLLAGLAAPVRTQAVLFAAPTGEVFYRHVFFREGQEQNALGTSDINYRPSLLFGDTAEERRNAQRMLLAARVNDAVTTAHSREMAVARQNALIGDANGRISGLLAKATGANARATAEEWWSWWDDYEESYLVGPKPVYFAYGCDEGSHYPDPYQYMPRLPQVKRVSCFVAGTQVWTETGPKPIEQIQVGDRVFAQDVQTGELALKPVLRTTERPPAEILDVLIGGQTLRCTGGHPFWVTGRGWLKARWLEPGQAVHTVEGATPVDKVVPSGKEATYNLEVADFNDYFVGEAKLLTHDVTSRRPTSAVLPGLLRR